MKNWKLSFTALHYIFPGKFVTISRASHAVSVVLAWNKVSTDEVSGLLMPASTEAPVQHIEMTDLHGSSAIVTKGQCHLHVHLANTCSDTDKCCSGSLKLPCLCQFLGTSWYSEKNNYLCDRYSWLQTLWVKANAPFCKLKEKPKHTYYGLAVKSVLPKMCTYEQP